jgi:hypothetical protein
MRMSLAPAKQGRQPGRVRAEIAWCLLGLAVFLLLPTLGYHHYGPFYRPIEVRQSAGRHSFLAAPVSEREPRYDADRWEPVAREAATNPVLAPALGNEAPPPIPIARCLMRLRMSMPAGDGSDPHIFA